MGDRWMIFTSWSKSLPHLRATSVMSRLWKVEMGRMWFELTEVEQITHLWWLSGILGGGRGCTYCAARWPFLSLEQPATFFMLG